jgi:hypothetical protein
VKTAVWVNGRRWRRVTSFAGAGPDEEVFVLDAENGDLEFGDGVNGARPPLGAEVIVSVYRHGAGGGDVGSEGPPIHTSRSDVNDTTELALWTVIRTHGRSIPIPIARRRSGPAG